MTWHALLPYEIEILYNKGRIHCVKALINRTKCSVRTAVQSVNKHVIFDVSEALSPAAIAALKMHAKIFPQSSVETLLKQLQTEI